jgi:glycosyltransferase involved in cell wall biosynthesis
MERLTQYRHFIAMILAVPKKEIDLTVEVSVVVPIWNDRESIIPFLEQIEPLLVSSVESYEIIFCVDPSDDGTEQAIKEICFTNSRIKAIFFAARAGQPQSTLAGLKHSNGQAVIVIDVDLQDPPSLIPEMVAKWREGLVLLIPRRISRSGEPVSKRLTAAAGYSFLSRFGIAPIPRNTGDYRLMDRSIVERVLSLPESHVFLRGLVALVEQNPNFIDFERPARAHGKTKYNKWFGGIKSGLNGIVSYSTALLDWLIIIGLLIASISFVVGIINILYKLTGNSVVEGNTQLIVMVTFIGGMQLVGLGILGLYIGRIYEESKNRPRWFIRQAIGISKVDLNDVRRSNSKSLGDDTR